MHLIESADYTEPGNGMKISSILGTVMQLHIFTYLFIGLNTFIAY